MKDGTPYAIISCDLDPVDRHLQGYGFDGLSPCDRIYRSAVPRVLALLDELGIRAVFFFIARDAGGQRGLLREIVSAGHEVASHSLSHPQPFRTIDDQALWEETATARMRLAEATGSEVLGFRAPAWDVDDRVLAAVRRAGYAYDASVFPTPALMVSRLAAYWKSTGKHSILSMDLVGHAFASSVPHECANGAAGLTEFPVSVTPWLRLPVYHTVSHLVPGWVFARALKSLLRSRRPVCYEFHAADLLDLENDGIDPRMRRHPGMMTPVDRKGASLRRILSAISRARRVVTYQQALASRLVSGRPPR